MSCQALESWEDDTHVIEAPVSSGIETHSSTSNHWQQLQRNKKETAVAMVMEEEKKEERKEHV